MKKKSVLLSVCLLITLAITNIAYDAKVRPRAESAESPPAAAAPLKLSSRAQSAPPKPIPGITMYDRIEDAPAWTIPYGQEFWRVSQTNHAPNTNGVQIDNGNFNLGNVIERVSHAIRRDGELQTPTLKALQYTAIFDDAGFSMVPHRFIGEEPLESPAMDGPDATSKRARTVPIYEPDPSATVQFQTVSIQSGGVPLYESTTEQLPSSFLGNTAQRLLNAEAGLVEHYQAGADGVEVSWLLNARPATAGALDIRAQFEGLAHHGVDAEGHLFADASGTPRITVSHATVVDSAGKRLEIPLAFSDGQISVTVPELALAELTFPIAVDPTISPAIGGGLPMRPDRQLDPTVAWNANQGAYLVVWSDWVSGSGNIHGTRVLPFGRVLDPDGILIWDGPGTVSGNYPKVASNGTDWLVTWESSAAEAAVDILAVRVTGTTVGNVITVCNVGTAQRQPDVASVGADYFIVWTDNRSVGGENIVGQQEIFGAAIRSGDLVEPQNGRGICIDQWRTTIDSQVYVAARSDVRIAGNGDNYLVVWRGTLPGTTADGIYGAVIDPAAQALDICTPVISSANIPVGFGSIPAIAGQNLSWLVAWRQTETCTAGDLWGTVVNNSGQPGTRSQLTTTCFQYETAPVLAGNGSSYLLLWEESGSQVFTFDIRGTRVSSAGVALDSSGFDVCTLDTDQVSPAIASNGSDYFAVFRTGPFAQSDIFGARIKANAPPNNVLDNIPISTTTHGDQLNIALPRDNRGTSMLVAWEDRRSGNRDIYGARLSSGGFIDVSGFAIATGLGDQMRPAVSTTSDESGWMVVWEDAQNLYARHIPLNAAQPFPASFTVCADASVQELASIASANGGHFVVWRDNRNVSSGWDVYASVLSYSGTAWQAGAVVGIVVESGDQNPSVGSTGTGTSARYMVVWERLASPGNYDIWGQLRMPNGTSATPPISICANGFTQGYPSVVGSANGSGYGVVWHDDRNGNFNIYGLHVTAAGGPGTPSGGRQITTAPAGDIFPEITASPLSANDGYFVAWYNNGTGTGFDVYGARLVLQGTAVSVDPSGVLPINTDVLSHGDDGVSVATVYPGGLTPVHWVGYRGNIFGPRLLRMSRIQY